jgi:hypothetical protein
MSEAARALRVTDRYVLWRNHAVTDHRGRLLLRLQFVGNAEAVRIFDALAWCGLFDAEEGDE